MLCGITIFVDSISFRELPDFLQLEPELNQEDKVGRLTKVLYKPAEKVYNPNQQEKENAWKRRVRCGM